MKIVNQNGEHTPEENKDVSMETIFKWMKEQGIDHYKNVTTSTTNPHGKPIVVKDIEIRRNCVELLKVEHAKEKEDAEIAVAKTKAKKFGEMQ